MQRNYVKNISCGHTLLLNVNVFNSQFHTNVAFKTGDQQVRKYATSVNQIFISDIVPRDFIIWCFIINKHIILVLEQWAD